MAKGKGSQQPQQGAQLPQKAQGPKKPVYPTLQHADLYQRANFTLQASAFLQQLRPAPESSSSDRKGKRKAIGNEGDAPDTNKLARSIMTANGRMVVHNQLKLDPTAKRITCRRCSTVLVPGLTSKIRNRPSKTHMNVTNTTCLSCNTKRTIPLHPTAQYDEELDGPKRTRRRRRLADRRKIPFHQREAVPLSEDPAGLSGGHTLWQSGGTVHRWGDIRPDSVEEQET